jgi:rubredoxin
MTDKLTQSDATLTLEEIDAFEKRVGNMDGCPSYLDEICAAARASVDQEIECPECGIRLGPKKFPDSDYVDQARGGWQPIETAPK